MCIQNPTEAKAPQWTKLIAKSANYNIGIPKISCLLNLFNIQSMGKLAYTYNGHKMKRKLPPYKYFYNYLQTDVWSRQK